MYNSIVNSYCKRQIKKLVSLIIFEGSFIKKVLSFLKYPLMIFLVWYLIASGKFDYKSLAIFLDVRRIVVIFAVILLLVLSSMFFSKRYQIFLNASGYVVRFVQAFTIILIGFFYNNFLPGGTGGDFMRVYYLKRKEKVPISIGTAVTLFDRLLGMLGLVVVAVLSLWWVAQYSSASFDLINNNTLLVSLVILIPIAAVATLFLLRIPAIYNFLERLLSRLFFGEKMVSFMETFQTLIMNTKAIIISFLLCLAGHLITLTCISILAYMLYGSSAVYATFAVAGIVLLTAVVPVTPGNIGWTEWLADGFYRIFGVEGGATIFALWRVVTVLFSLIGGIVYLRAGGKKTVEGVQESSTD